MLAHHLQHCGAEAVRDVIRLKVFVILYPAFFPILNQSYRFFCELRIQGPFSILIRLCPRYKPEHGRAILR